MAKATPDTSSRGTVLSILQHGPMFERDIHSRMKLHFHFEQINEALRELEEAGRITSVLVVGAGTKYELAGTPQQKPPFFSFRRITPLLAGTPEWIVEAPSPEGNRLVCWCTREFDAQLICAALNGAQP